MAIHVLYLDDEVALCEIFEDLFQEPGVVVKSFQDGRSAIEYAKNNPVDVAFLDYRVPGMLGDEVALKLPPQIPKYLITGELEPTPRYEFAGVLSKPIEAGRVSDILNRLKMAPK